MRKELDDKLCEKYPEIFIQRHQSMQVTCMCWGFDVGDGWYNILDRLCANIQGHINQSIKNVKWANEWNKENPDKQHEVPKAVGQVEATQVKEKFGTLRFYYNGGDDTIEGMVDMAESMSAVTCEDCGNPGKLVGQGWYSTRCKEHAKEGEWDETPETNPY